MLSADEDRDNYTGLVWQRPDSSQTAPMAVMAWADAPGAYCTGLTIGGHAWRLPSIRELATLVDEAQVAPSINHTMFPGTKYGSKSNNWYWASHQAAGIDDRGMGDQLRRRIHRLQRGRVGRLELFHWRVGEVREVIVCSDGGAA